MDRSHARKMKFESRTNKQRFVFLELLMEPKTYLERCVLTSVYLLVPECELVTLDNTRVGEVLEPGWGKPTKNAAIILTQAPPPPDHIWGHSCYSISAEYKVSVSRSGGVMSSVTTL